MALEKFHFTTNDGEEIVVPYMMDAITRKTYKKMMKIVKKNGPEAVDDDEFFKAAGFSDELIEQLDELSMREYQKFFDAWTGESGESSAS